MCKSLMLWLVLLLTESLMAQCSISLGEKRLLMVACWVTKFNLAPVIASVRVREEEESLS